MNLFGLLFIQYRDGDKITFASRWMDWHGRLFMGRPEDKGLDWVRDDLRKNFYWDKVDRILPTDGKELREWQEHSMFLAQYRNFEAPVAAKIVSVTSLIVVFALVGFGALL